LNRNRLELIGFISVIASLVFVGMEISQNTTAVRGATNQAISDQASELYLTIATDRNLAGLVKKLYDDVPREAFGPIDDMQLFMTVLTGLRRVENIFLQLEDNILDERAFDRIGLSFYRSKYGRQIWEDNQQFFDQSFVPFFKELLDKE
tara:strand:+ start:874 stop:1320 length:447 start_codon:yes stop_codon:yes gene_type:complete